MHHYKQTKTQVAIRFFTYGVLTVAVLVLSAIGILSVLGYQFNPSEGSLEQTALIQFVSAPTGAHVSVDGKLLSGNTGTSTNVPGGSHTAVLSLAGYRDWQKTFDVDGGTVLWLNYALLIPRSLQTSDVHELSAPVTSDQTSPDKKWRLLTLADKPDSLTLLNLSNPSNPSLNTYALPDDTLTKAADGSLGSVSVVSWDSGSRYALLRHTYGNAQSGQSTEYLRFDRQNPSSVRNISTELGVTNINKIGFSDASGNTYEALVGTDIRKLDIGAGSISSPLVSNVTQMFYTDGSDTIGYVRVDDNITSVGVYRDPGGLVTTETYSVTPNDLLIAYNEYYGYRYLATYHDSTVYVIQSPDTRQPTVVKSIKVPGVTWLYFSPDGRMLVAQSGNTFMTYDLETNTEFNQTLGSANGAAEYAWLDDFHLVSDAAGTITMSDFDGANQQTLGTSTAGTGVQLSNDAQWLFSIGTNQAGKPVVQRTALRVQ